jgi:hypothetical protein
MMSKRALQGPSIEELLAAHQRACDAHLRNVRDVLASTRAAWEEAKSSDPTRQGATYSTSGRRGGVNL